MKNLVVITGAGISAESGVKTFRDADGLWEGYDIMEVASPEGFHNNPSMVYEFYNARRRQLKEVSPNPAHQFLASLETIFNVVVITQNVDDLHERGGSNHILHLHGELLKARTIKPPHTVLTWTDDLNENHTTSEGQSLRPHIVWFGEAVPMIAQAENMCKTADVCVIIGTSLQVYPAAGLMHSLPANTPIVYIDPAPVLDHYFLANHSDLHILESTAVQAIPDLKQLLEKWM